MSDPGCEAKNKSKAQIAVAASLTEPVISNSMEDLAIEEDHVDERENGLEAQDLRNPVDGMDPEGEDGDSISPCSTVVPSNTPVTGDSGHVSPTMESSLDSLSDGAQQLQDAQESSIVNDDTEAVVTDVAATLSLTPSEKPDVSSSASALSNGDTSKNKTKVKAVKDEKTEEKKKTKKKEDKSGEHILRALNSLQRPEEKLAALCKKFADLHEEHRVLQASFKTQQRNLTAVGREKDQLQSEHTKAMMAKGKLESLCRELQKHNKIIENESIKRAKESDEKRKEISAHFNTTISEIQSQMNENSEKNNLLRKENENLAEQLRTFMSQCQARDEHFKKLQEQHDLENKLAAAKQAQAEAIIREIEERSNKEKELMMLKLAEMSKKAQLTDSQLQLYKSKYDEFSDLHTRSSETFQKYKTEMDRMSKRIKKLEKDGLQWKSKWEASSKNLLEEYEARTKSEKEAAVYAQKVQKLESLCRALQTELHRKKADSDTNEAGNAQPGNPIKDNISASVLPILPDKPSTITEPPSLPEVAASSTESASPQPPSINSSESPKSPVAEFEEGTEMPTNQSWVEKGLPDDLHNACGKEDKANCNLGTALSLSTTAAST